MRIIDKNLAIANRSRVSCAHNSSRASPWPWNLRYGSLKVTGNGTIGKITTYTITIHDLLLDELLDVEYYRDLEMWVRSHLRSLKVYHLKVWVRFPNFSYPKPNPNYNPNPNFNLWLGVNVMKIAPFDRPYATFYWSAIVNIALSCTIFELFDVE